MWIIAALKKKFGVFMFNCVVKYDQYVDKNVLLSSSLFDKKLQANFIYWNKNGHNFKRKEKSESCLKVTVSLSSTILMYKNF